MDLCTTCKQKQTNKKTTEIFLFYNFFLYFVYFVVVATNCSVIKIDHSTYYTETVLSKTVLFGDPFSLPPGFERRLPLVLLESVFHTKICFFLQNLI